MARPTPHLTIICVIWLAAPATQAAVTFKRHGDDIHVRTKRYELVLRQGLFVYVENRLTGDVYADARSGVIDPALVRGVSSPAWDRRAFDSLQPQWGGIGVGETIEDSAIREHSPCLGFPDRESDVKLRLAPPNGAVVKYSGLRSSKGRDLGAKLWLHLRVDERTGDLIVRSTGRSDTVPLGGAAVCFAGLAQDAAFIVPQLGGHKYTASQGHRHISPLWPRFWQFGLVIAEFPRGAMSVWADDPKLRGKRLFAEVGGDQPNLSVMSFSNLPYEAHRQIEGVRWRFNVYDGNWMKPAAAYKQWLHGTHGLVSLAEQTPAWVAKIRTVYNGTPNLTELHELAKKLTPEERSTVLYGMWQSWLHPETNTDTAPDGHRWLPYNPSWGRYKGRPGVKEFIAEAHRLGFRVLVFTNLIAVNWHHPLLWGWPRALQTEMLDPALREQYLARKRRRALAYIHQADPGWQRFCIETLKRLVQEYDVDAVYLDCSSVVQNGIVHNGMNPFQGAAAWHRAVRKALPNLALLGEQIHEATLAGEAFALESVVGWGSRKVQGLLQESGHPINGYLMGDYTNRFHWPRADGWGRWQDRSERACHIANSMIDRVRLLGRYQLRYAFPESWEENVRCYLRGNDGRLFRYVSDHGSRFDATDDTGKREVLYWRLHETTAAPIPGVIEQWPAYDRSGRAIGLDPAQHYLMHPGPPGQMPFRVSGLSPGVVLSEARVHDAHAILKLGGSKCRGALRVSSRKPILAASSGTGGLVTVVKEGATDYRTQPIEAPGSVVLFMTEAASSAFPANLLAPGWTWEMVRNGAAVAVPPSLLRRFTPSRGRARKGDLGPQARLLVYPYSKAEKRVYRVVRLPEQGSPVLSVQYQVAIRGKLTKYADGVNFMVRVNGKELMRELVPNSTEWRSMQFPLNAYRGQPILVTLATDGHVLGQCDYAYWGDVMIHVGPQGKESR